jgi:hypothetical protein
MPYINGYQYDTEQGAIDAREACDAYYGIPSSPDDITRNWVEYNIADLNDPIFYYIRYDISLLQILGEPSNFNVILPPLI